MGAEMGAKMGEGFLHRLPALASIPAALHAEIERLCVPFSAAADTLIFAQEEEADCLYFLIDGEISLWVRSLGDESGQIATLRSGSLFGEIALLDQGRRSTTARAVSASSGWRLSRARFEALCDGCAPAAMALLDAIIIHTSGRIAQVIRACSDHPCATLLRPRPADPPRAPADLPAREALARRLLARVGAASSRLPAAALFALPADLIAELGTLERWPRGSQLAAEGEPAGQIWLVLSGALRSAIPRAGPRADPQSAPAAPQHGLEQLLINGPGSLAGVLGTVDARPRPLSVDACEDAWVLAISRDRFEELQSGNSPLAFALTSACAVSLATDLRQLNRHLARLRGLICPPEALCAG